jgi:hypothetical protein
MLSNSKRFNADDNAGVDLYDSTHDNEHASIFSQYLQHPSEPNEKLYNSENLFDDSNILNAKWLRKTKAYLARRNKI